MINQKEKHQSDRHFSGIFLGLIIGFIIGFLLKEEDKKKLLALAQEKINQAGEEGKKLEKHRRLFFKRRTRI